VARLGDRRVLLAAIVLLALGCRLAGVGDRLSADEGYSWLVASAPDAGAFLARLARFENTPPLFYLLLSPLPLHDDEVWLRLPSLLAGVAAVPVLYAAVRPLLGVRAALIAALALAVAPYAVSFSNYARGFELATLGLLVALWAAARLATGARPRWWWLYGAGAVAALYSEYVAALFLVPLALALFALRPRARTLAFALAPFLAVLPWIGQIERSRDFAGVTKVDPTYPGPSPGAVRDTLVALVFGEHGSAGAVGVRWLQLLAIVVVVGAAVVLLARRSRTAVILIAGTGAGALVLHALTALVGPDVFASRYMTALIPLGAALVGGAVAALPWRAAVPAVALALVAVGAAVIVQRTGRELEPDYARAAPVVRAAGARMVLTNSAVIEYYLRDPRPTLDRPFGLGPGREARTKAPYAVVDDARVGAGARPGRGRRGAIGPIVVRTVP
jgi:4-amino-4-deoxy-L-arabinose transferase-like glycosyltransferase